MIISKSASRNSSTKFKFVFEENTSKSYGDLETAIRMSTIAETHRYHIVMVKLPKIFHLSHGRHI
jgi:hypothetical protein